MQTAQVRSGLGIGALTGIVAWSCCITAVVLGFLGLSAAAGFFAMIKTQYHWWLVGLAFISMDVAIYYFMKRYHGACDIKTIQGNWAQIVFIILAALAAYFILQAILPILVGAAHVPMPS